MADQPRFYVYRDSKREWRWRFRAANGEIIAVSSESYKELRACDYSILLLKQEAPGAVVIHETQK